MKHGGDSSTELRVVGAAYCWVVTYVSGGCAVREETG